MTQLGKIAVIDVDDSLLCGNSLKMLLMKTIVCQVKRGRWLAFSQLCYEILRRILHLSSHVQLKQCICLSALDVLTPDDFEALTVAMLAKVRPSVRRVINHWIADGGCVVIASAGMRFSLKEMVARMGLRHLVATDMTPDGSAMGTETRSAMKLQGVKDLAAAHNLGDIGLVVTDHIDDLPLLSLPDIQRILVSPSRSLLKVLDDSSLPYEIIS